MGTAINIVIVYNEGSFKAKDFGEASIENKSTLLGTVSATDSAYWTSANLHKYELVDESDWLQLGQTEENTFTRLIIGETEPSNLGVWPTKENPVMYKINSIYISMDMSITHIERKTYSILEWMGDVGGLFDGLKIVGGFLIWPIATFTMRLEMLSALTYN